MRVLLLGSGGREHALAWKLSQSPSLSKLYCAPGNVGTAAIAENVELPILDAVAVSNWAVEKKIDLVVVGPEAPLVAGVSNALAQKGIAVFGPSKEASRLEGSKAFAKEVMIAANVPTARYEVCESLAEAETRIRQWQSVVVKADGLAAGKGVVVAHTQAEAWAAISSLRELGSAASRLVLEELLEGVEVSVMALCDGEQFVFLPTAQDHKRVGENDSGPNTGGMGAFSPTPFLTQQELDEVGKKVFVPTLRELNKRGMPFRGALYAGLMLTSQGIRVLEFNCRLGDPETQVLMMQVEDDLLPVLAQCANGQLRTSSLRLKSGASIGVVLAAQGYPATVRTGDEVRGLEASLPTSVQIFLSGVRRENSGVVTSGGRVMTVCAHGHSLEAARAEAYQAIENIAFSGMHYRRDIGFRGLTKP